MAPEFLGQSVSDSQEEGRGTGRRQHQVYLALIGAHGTGQHRWTFLMRTKFICLLQYEYCSIQMLNKGHCSHYTLSYISENFLCIVCLVVAFVVRCTDNGSCMSCIDGVVAIQCNCCETMAMG